MPAAMICAMSSTESKSFDPDTTNREPSPLGTPDTDAYPSAEYPISMEPSMPVTSAAYRMSLPLRVRAPRKPLPTSESARAGPSLFRHSDPNRRVWLSSTSCRPSASTWNLPASAAVQYNVPPASIQRRRRQSDVPS